MNGDRSRSIGVRPDAGRPARPLLAGGLADRARGVDVATVLLVLGIVLYVVVFTAAAWYKYDTYLMGFDLGVHEQVLWNTAHGRIAATSAFAATDSYLGIDTIPTELLLAPLYALAPTTYTMLFLQTLALGLGAVPVFLLVRDRFGRRWAGLVFAAMFMLYHPVEYMNLYEFQIRAFATTLLLWAFYALERRRFWPFLVFALLALGCRSDVGLVLAGMGLYAWLERWPRRREAGAEDRGLAPARFTLLPIALGLGWFVLCLEVLVPLFRGGAPSLYIDIIYGWLGDTPGAILRTLATRPGFVAAQVVTPDRLRYLLEMFLPFGFLLLLQPRILLITLPIFALNLLSSSPNIHASTHYHYQALIIPFMVVGSAYGLRWLLDRLAAGPRWRAAALGALLALALLCNTVIFSSTSRNPVLGLLGRRPDRARIDAVERLLAQVPPDAALTATSSIGPHAARRERLFFFPGNVIYPAEKVELGDYLLIDDAEARPEGKKLLAELATSGRYQRLAADRGVSLWRRAGR